MWIEVKGGSVRINLATARKALRHPDGTVSVWWAAVADCNVRDYMDLEGEDAELAWKLLGLECRRSREVAEGHA